MELHTKEIVAATSSKGNQEKWYDKTSGLWYKADSAAFEAMAETAASELLHGSNIRELGFDYVRYHIEKVKLHRHQQITCVSANFLAPGEELVTLARLLKAELGEDYQKIFHARTRIVQRLQTLTDEVERITGLDRFGPYLTALFEFDALILNEDRHLNNIAVRYGPNGYSYCPLFDHGAGFLLDPALFPLDIETKSFFPQTVARPFQCRFSTQVKAARELYRPQLSFGIDSASWGEAIKSAAKFYPQMYQPYLAQRMMGVVEHQRRSLGL